MDHFQGLKYSKIKIQSIHNLQNCFLWASRTTKIDFKENLSCVNFPTFLCESLSKSLPRSVVLVKSLISIFLDILFLLQIHVVVDATSSRSLLDRQVAIENMKKIGAFINTTEGVILNLLGDKDHKQFKSVQKLIKDLNPLNKALLSAKLWYYMHLIWNLRKYRIQKTHACVSNFHEDKVLPCWLNVFKNTFLFS